MASTEEKKDAFACYQRSQISNAQLAMLKSSVRDLVSTMEAIGERGYHMAGFYHLADSLRHMSEARKLTK